MLTLTDLNMLQIQYFDRTTGKCSQIHVSARMHMITVYFKAIKAVFTSWRCRVQSAQKCLDYALVKIRNNSQDMSLKP